MPLNKSRGNMYPWVTHTWNPVRGCKHGCEYCYVRSLKDYSTEPRLVPEELCTNLGSGKTIFVCSTGDLFGNWVPNDWILGVLHRCLKFDNNYFFQSKNPGRFIDFLFPMLLLHLERFMFGTTVETNREVDRSIWVPDRIDRIRSMQRVRKLFPVMISIEPIMDFDLEAMVDWIGSVRPKFVSIGADSKGHNLPEPSPEKVSRLIHELSQVTEVKVKSNLRRLLG